MFETAFGMKTHGYLFTDTLIIRKRVNRRRNFSDKLYFVEYFIYLSKPAPN